MEKLTYWQKRAVITKMIMLGYVDEYNEELAALYIAAINAIDRKLAEWYGRFYDPKAMNYQTAQLDLTANEMIQFKSDVQDYIKLGETIDYSDEWRAELERLALVNRITRLESLETHIYQKLEEIYGHEKGTLDELFRSQYLGMFFRTAYDLQERMNQFTPITVNDSKVNETLETPWANDGMIYSERVWTSKEKLKQALKVILAQGLILGRAYGQIAQEVIKKMNSAKSNAMTIVETEAAHFQQTAQKDVFDFYEVEKVRILATLDMKTCERCAALHMTTVDQKDNIPGVTTPQFHPNCRCTTEPIKEIVVRSTDPITGEVRRTYDYAEWYERYVSGVAS